MNLQDEILSVKHEVWNIDKLIPYDRNPRKNDHVVDEMMGKIKEFGLPIPLCIRPDGLIVDGHLRYKALKKLGIEQIPVAVNDTWTPAKVKAFRLSANKMSEKAEWDVGFLALEFQELQEFNYDLMHTGFEDKEINSICGQMDFAPASEDEQGKLDEKKPVICPNCEYAFHTKA